ncbi:hypothetical protein FJY90_07030 [Candidatus Gottesmanbacteria bacterium]|nr:hypothetical protein [Candidatus Gottesmanbacteria bacterium]
MKTIKPPLSIDYEYIETEDSDLPLSEVYAFLFRKICQQYEAKNKLLEIEYTDKIEFPISLLTSLISVQYTYY